MNIHKKDKALIASACLLFAAVVSAVIYWEPNFLTQIQEAVTQQESEPKLLDLTGQIRYGKDESTGMCFANIRTADSDPRLWRTVARVPCKALERLE